MATGVMRELNNVRLYGGQSVSIGIIDHEFVHVGKQQGWETEIDGRGYCAFYGRIDCHVHDRTPGQTHKEDLASIQLASAAGGTPTIASMANSTPCITTADRFKEKAALLRSSKLTHLQWFGATPTNFAEFKKVVHLPECAGVKLCTANTTATGEMLVDKRQDKADWCKVVADCGGLMAVHLEKEARINRKEKEWRRKGIELGLRHHCVIRDPRCESDELHEFLPLALRAGCRVHICHVSLSSSVHEIRAAQRQGLNVTFELCPQYWLLSEEALDGDEGWRAKFNPAARSPQEAQEMERIVCDEGIQGAIIATDHAPHTIGEKRHYHPDPFLVPSGMPGLDTCTSVCWELVHRGKMSRQRFADLTARNPAKLLGLQTKGEIAPGYDADIMLIDDGAATTLRDQDMKTKCGWTPFNGMVVHGVPMFVMARGEILLNRLNE